MSLQTIIISLLIACIICGCGQRHDNKLLTRIESMQNSDPKTALDSLNAIDCTRLTERDRHYHDFLMVKMSDKAYELHESDSMIMDVLEYESSHKDNGRYEETLYYAGRVYTDLGDYPRALSYYKQALDAVRETHDSTDLKARITSQYGLLLTHMHLYEEAIPYALSTMEMNRKTTDTVNLIHDIHSLAWLYMKTGEPDRSEQLYHKALAMAGDRYKFHAAKSRMYLASIKNSLNQTDSALFYVQDIAEEVHPSIRAFALTIAGNIYLDAGMKDSAYICARELIAGSDSISKEMGYEILFDEDMENFVSTDSLRRYMNDYHSLVSSRFSSNTAELAIIQQSMYNYNKHVKEKEKAEKDRRIYFAFAMLLIAVSSVLGCIILFIRNRNKANIIKLQQALSNLKLLRAELEKSNSIKPTGQPADENGSEYGEKKISADATLMTNPTGEDLRKCMQTELLEIYNQGSDRIETDPEIVASDIYQQFIDIAHSGDMVVDSSPLWDDLEKVVLKCAPCFKKNLFLLASGNLSVAEIHTALLIKCGFRPTDMTRILGKSNGAIISRRDSLSLKVLDTKTSAKIITGIIKLL